MSYVIEHITLNLNKDSLEEVKVEKCMTLNSELSTYGNIPFPNFLNFSSVLTCCQRRNNDCICLKKVYQSSS